MLITSRDNETVRQARRLLTDAKARRAANAFVIEGARLCEDAVRSGVAVETALVTARAGERYPDRVAAVCAAAGRTLEITESVAATLSDTETAQGVFCLCKALDNRRILDKIESDALYTFNAGHWLALENVRDPGNLGTIIRTAEALGIDGLILSDGCCDVTSPKVLRGSMGGVFRLPLFTAASMPTAVKRLQEAGLCAYACVPVRDADTLSVVDAPLSAGSVCLIGNEANGLTDDTIAVCRRRLTIPMAGRAESLNAAIAASLVMWEMARRAQTNG